MSVLDGARRWRRSPIWWKRHSLSLVLAAFLLWQSAVYAALAWRDWSAEQAAHSQLATWWPDFAVYATAEWFVSVLADTYGALLLVLATKWFYEQGSSEAHDPPDEGTDP